MNLKKTITEIAEEFHSKFPKELKGARTVGREAEYPLVTSEGEAADVGLIWASLEKRSQFEKILDYPKGSQFLVGLNGKDYSFASEVGKGTMEVITGPFSSLLELKSAHEKAMKTLVGAAQENGFKVLGLGVQPKEKLRDDMMTAKQRYPELLKVLGSVWLSFAISASDQVQIDIKQSELVELTNFGNLMAPLLIALCANSPFLEGSESEFQCGREGLKHGILPDECHYGMIREPYRDLEDFIEKMISKTCLILKKEDGNFYGFNRPFSEHLKEKGVDFKDFLVHDHYVWNSVRARTAHGTIEVRPACQQPWSEHMAASALSLGLFESHREVNQYLIRVFGEELWDEMFRFQTSVIKQGLGVEEPQKDFFKEIVGFAQKGLESRKMGEENLLESIHRRLHERKTPAARAVELYRKSGMDAVLAAASIDPESLSG